MNFRDMTKDEKMYYEQIKVRDDDLDVGLGVLAMIAAVVLILLAIELFK